MVAVLEKEVSALDEIRSSLESLFSLVSSDVEISKVYEKLAQLEGKSLAEVLNYPTIICQKLDLAQELQKQALSYHDIVDLYIEQGDKAKANNDDKLTFEIEHRAIDSLREARQSSARCIRTLNEIINKYWNYLTLESQATFRNWANSLLENPREWAKEYQVKEGSEELRLAYLDFIAAIIKADDSNKSKPKLSKTKIDRKVEPEDNLRAYLQPVKVDVAALKGILQKPDREPVSIEQMDEAILQNGGQLA